MNKKTILAILAVVIVAIGATMIATHHSSTKTMSMNTSSNSAPTTNSVSTDTVSITNYAFSPATITVKVGTTVTWTNNDSVHHTVTMDSGSSGPASSELGQGQKYSYKFTSAGTYTYHCKIHPDMHGTVVVKG